MSVGDLSAPGAVPVRVQPMNTLRDFLGTRLDDKGVPGWSYRAAMQHIASEGRGVVVLGGTETPHTILETSINYFMQSSGRRHPKLSTDWHRCTNAKQLA